MNTSLTYTLIVTGSVAIVLLSLLIRRQLRSQREQKAQRAAEAARLEQEAQAHRRYLIDMTR
jgi:type II secretory pathway pseudopilin PulG